MPSYRAQFVESVYQGQMGISTQKCKIPIDQQLQQSLFRSKFIFFNHLKHFMSLCFRKKRQMSILCQFRKLCPKDHCFPLFYQVDKSVNQIQIYMTFCLCEPL